MRLTIVTPAEFHLDEVHVGDSIAVNGACMTVTKIEGNAFSIDVSAESLSKTTGLDTFGEVNLEKAIQHGLESRLELRQREIESKELAFDMIKTKALNEFKGDIALSFGLIGDNRHLEKI